MSDALASLRLLVATAVRVAPAQAVLSFLEVAGLVLQRLTPLWIGLLVAGATGGPDRSSLLGAAGLITSLGLGALFVVWGVNCRLRMLDEIGFHFEYELARTVGSARTLDQLDSNALRATLQIIRDRLGALGGSFNSLVGAANGVVPPISSIAVAVAIDWRLSLLVLAAMPSLLHARLSLRWENAAEEAAAHAGVSSGEWSRLILGDAYSELRTFGALTWAREQAMAQAAAWRRPFASAEVRSAWLGLACDAVYAAVAVGTLAWIVAAPGGVGPLVSGTAALVAILIVASDLREGFEGFRSSIQMLGQSLRTLSRFRAVLTELGTPQPARDATFGGDIRLRDVSFTYPGAEHPAVKSLSIDIPAGVVVAIVGENGAGKSTLSDLLLGLQLPDIGTVEAGGQTIDQGNVTAWRSRCSAVTQDFVRFQLTVSDAVGIGEMVVDQKTFQQRPTAGLAVSRALHTTGAADFVARLPDQDQTRLGAELGGQDLSGGQWQRLAASRGLLRAAPLLTVMDEPTSALDAYAEDVLLAALMDRAVTTQESGEAVAVVVTHRMATARRADLVLVMHEGVLVESGTPEELMRSATRYRALFDMQASEYLRD